MPFAARDLTQLKHAENGPFESNLPDAALRFSWHKRLKSGPTFPLRCLDVTANPNIRSQTDKRVAEAADRDRYTTRGRLFGFASAAIAS